MTNFGPIHKLIVHSVGEPYGPLSTEEFEDCEVEHADCTYNVEAERYECGVAFNMEQVGLRFSLHYVGTPVTEPGEYAIQAWAETYRGFDYTEHDGGIALVKPAVEANCAGYVDVLWQEVACPWQAQAVEHGRCQACNGKQMIESNCRGW